MTNETENQKTKIANTFVPSTKIVKAMKLMEAQRIAVSKLLDTIKSASDEYIGWRDENNDSDLTELRRNNFVQLLSDLAPRLDAIQLWNGSDWIFMQIASTTEEVEETEPEPKQITATDPIKEHKKILGTVNVTKAKGLNFKNKADVEIMLNCINCFKEKYEEEKMNNGDLGSLVLTYNECLKYIEENKEHKTTFPKKWKENLLKSLLDDAWILGKSPDGDTTVKPFSKGIEGWVTGDRLHPTAIGDWPVRITKYMKP